MRILILGNLANDGYSVAKGLWSMNADADLAVNISDFGMALPEWEDGDISNSVDPYNVKVGDLEKIVSDRIIYFDFQNKISRKKHLMTKVKARIDLIKLMRNYDVLEVHVPYAMYSQFSRIPYVAYDAGWIRHLPFEKGIRAMLGRRGYRKAKSIIMTNPDTYQIFDNLSYLDPQKIHFSPFAIDPAKYTPSRDHNLRSKYASQDQILLFSPARQTWKEKGNNKMITAFARFVKIFPNSKLIMVAWSVDEARSKE